MAAQKTAAGRNPADVLSAARNLHDLIDSSGEWHLRFLAFRRS
jgi:hypothetical protein